MAFVALIMPFLILVSILLIVLGVKSMRKWNERKRRGENPRQLGNVMATIIFCLGLMFLSIPAMGVFNFLVILGVQNISFTMQTINAFRLERAESERVIYWKKWTNDRVTNSFYLDGKTFSKVTPASFYLDFKDMQIGKPFANIKGNPDVDSIFEGLDWSLKSTRYYSTLCPVTNDKGLDIYYADGVWGRGLYVYSQEKKEIEEYYNDIANYDIQNIVCESEIYSEEGLLHRGNGDRYDRIQKNVILTGDSFAVWLELLDSAEVLESVDVPEIYIETRRAAISGTPLYGYDKKRLYAYTNDKIAYKYIELALFGDTIYLKPGIGYEYDSIFNVIPLPKDLNEYVLATIFDE